MRRATVSGVSTLMPDRSMTPNMMALPDSLASTGQSRLGCAVSTALLMSGTLPPAMMECQSAVAPECFTASAHLRDSAAKDARNCRLPMN